MADEDKRDFEEEEERAREEMKQLEEADEVPKDPLEWPDGKAKYVTFGDQDGGAYGEGATEKLGPADLTHHEDGSISVAGEKVDDPSQFKGEPIKSGVIEQIEESKRRYHEDQSGDESE